MSLQRRPFDPKFQVEAVAPTNHSIYTQKTRLNDLSYGIWTGLIFFRFVTVVTICQASDGQTDGGTDGRTDRILIARPRLHSMQHGKNTCMQGRGQWAYKHVSRPDLYLIYGFFFHRAAWNAMRILSVCPSVCQTRAL